MTEIKITTFNENLCTVDCKEKSPQAFLPAYSDKLSLRDSVWIARQILSEDNPNFKGLYNFLRDSIPYMGKAEIILGIAAENYKVEIWHFEVPKCRRHGGTYYVLVNSAAAPEGAVKLAELAI